MKGLSLQQPWATLVAAGHKRYETRSWPTSYHGEVAIHASKTFPWVCQVLAARPPFRALLEAAEEQCRQPAAALRIKNLPLGVIVAVADIHHAGATYWGKDDCIHIRGIDAPVTGNELAFGDFSPGRFAWSLTNVRRLAIPVSCKGALGLWSVPADVEAEVRGQC